MQNVRKYGKLSKFYAIVRETSRRFVDRPRHCVVVCQGPGGPQCAPPAGPPHPLHRRGGVHLRHGGHAGHPHRGCRSVVSCGKHCYRYLFADYWYADAVEDASIEVSREKEELWIDSLVTKLCCVHLTCQAVKLFLCNVPNLLHCLFIMTYY